MKFGYNFNYSSEFPTNYVLLEICVDFHMFNLKNCDMLCVEGVRGGRVGEIASRILYRFFDSFTGKTTINAVFTAITDTLLGWLNHSNYKCSTKLGWQKSTI